MHMEGAGSALSRLLDVMQRFGGGDVNLKRSKVKQGFRISKHFLYNRVAINRGSPS